MALAYDSRRATRDVDALFKPHGIVHDEALAVAAELGLPRWWLNKQASSYIAPGGDPAASRVFDHSGLRVFAASPEHLLAMKAFAARPRDAEDEARKRRETTGTIQVNWTRARPPLPSRTTSPSGSKLGITAGQSYRTSRPVTARPISIRWISLVPSKMVKLFGLGNRDQGLCS
jgi:hypothetical protein